METRSVLVADNKEQSTHRKDITDKLDETIEVQETSDSLQEATNIDLEEGLDILDGDGENLDDLLEDRSQDIGGTIIVTELS